MFYQIFPLISDVAMGDHNFDQEILKPASKPVLLSSDEMRRVLDDLGKEENEEEEEESEFDRVLADMPDVDADYSELSLGFNEELCIGNSLTGDGVNTSPSIIDHPNAEARSIVSPSSSSSLSASSTLVKATPLNVTSSITSTSSILKSDQENQERPELDQELTLSTNSSLISPPVPIHKGDLIEFLVGDKTWFLVDVTGRGKIGGRNQNYLNVRYSDGSEGGVFIDQHQWRMVSRQREIGEECTPSVPGAAPINTRLHRVTVEIPSSTEAETTTDEDEEAQELSGPREPKESVIISRKRKRRKRRDRPRSRKISVEETSYHPSNSIKKGDIIEFLVKEKKGDDLKFKVEVLSKGKSSGRNKNYLNVRYADGSVGGVFIDRHEWRIIKKDSVQSQSVSSTEQPN